MRQYALDRIGDGVPEITLEDLDNLRRLDRFIRDGRKAWIGEPLIGPQYDRLRRQGLTRRLDPDLIKGSVLVITDRGRAELGEAAGVDNPEA